MVKEPQEYLSMAIKKIFYVPLEVLTAKIKRMPER